MARVDLMVVGDNESSPDDYLYLPKHPAGYTLFVYGTFASAEATVQICTADPDSGTWIDLVQPTDLTTAYAFTANGTLWVPGGFLRIVTDDAGDATTSISLGAF